MINRNNSYKGNNQENNRSDWTGTEPDIFTTSKPHSVFKQNQNKIIVGLIIFFVFNLVLAKQMQKKTNLQTKAGTNTANLSINPATKTIPPVATFQVWLTVDNPTGFIRADLTFNPSLVKLTSEITINPTLEKTVYIEPNNSEFKTVFRKTTMAEANSTGKISIIILLDPLSRSTPFTGTFMLASLNATANTAQNTNTNISFDNASMQIVNMDTSLFTITSTGTSLTLNTPNVTLSPTPSGKPGDTDGDGDVDIFDYNNLISHFGQNFPAADFNKNGTVDIYDYNTILTNFGK